MKYKFMDGTTIEGTEMAVIEYMKSNEFDPDRFDNVDEYLKHVQQNMWRFFGKSIVLEGETEKDRCRSFVAQMIDHGFVKECKNH